MTTKNQMTTKKHETVLVCVDGTSGSAAAVRWAATEAARRGARLHAVHVVDHSWRHDAPLEAGPERDVDHARQTVPNQVATWVAETGADVAIAVSVVSGEVATRLAHESADAYLVVVGAPDGIHHQGLPALLRTECPCPVVVVTADGDAEIFGGPDPILHTSPMHVRDVMSSPAVTTKPTDALAQVARTLDRLSLTSLPVVDDNHRLVGVVGEADVIAQLTRPPGPGSVKESRVSDVMTHQVLTVSADDELHDVVALMKGTTVKSLPVLLHERVVGMVSRRDVVRAMARGDLDAHQPSHPVTC